MKNAINARSVLTVTIQSLVARNATVTITEFSMAIFNVTFYLVPASAKRTSTVATAIIAIPDITLSLIVISVIATFEVPPMTFAIKDHQTVCVKRTYKGPLAMFARKECSISKRTMRKDVVNVSVSARRLDVTQLRFTEAT